MPRPDLRPMGGIAVANKPTFSGRQIIGVFGSVLLTPVQAIVALVWTFLLALAVDHFERTLGVRPGNSNGANLLGLGEVCLFAGLLSFPVARFFPVLSKGAHLTWLLGAYPLAHVYGPTVDRKGITAAVREAVSTKTEFPSIVLTSICVCLCAYSAFAIVGWIVRKQAARLASRSYGVPPGDASTVLQGF